MNESKIKINPCKACKQKFDITDINNINQCCYDTLGAFEGEISLANILNTPGAANCNQCVQESIDSLGRDRCNLRLTAYPSWVQVPHYLPALLNIEPTLEAAKNKCIQLCKSNRYPNECVEKCKLDASAVETVEKFTFNKKFNQTNTAVMGVVSAIAILACIFFLAWCFKKYKPDVSKSLESRL